ncbi:MAG: transglutaminase domain-containing protein [Phycisphaeraceae bacterium]|nr:transglutaminase domain-containing protein [Phycisphaeraceae bacterium]
MRTLLAILTLAVFTAPVFAQQRSSRPAADEGPVLTLTERRLWSLRVTISGRTAPTNARHATPRPLLRTGQPGLGQQGSIDLRAATIVVPILERSASHDAALSHATWELRFNRQVVPQDRLGAPSGQPDLINLLQSVMIADPSGAPLVPLVLNAEQLEFRLQVPVFTHETRYDDARAARIGWPSQWPEFVQPSREPSPFIPSDDPFVAQLLDDWTQGAHRSMAPAVLAKHLAKRIVDTIQPNGLGVVPWDLGMGSHPFDVIGPCDDSTDGLWLLPGSSRAFRPARRDHDTVDATRFIRGFNVYEPTGVITNNRCFTPRIRQPIETGRANPAVIANLYVALLRAAGIPARVVIGTEVSPEDLRSVPNTHIPPRTFPEVTINGFRVSTRGSLIRFWTEFYLFDEDSNRGEWIPVDLHRQRLESSRAPDIDRAWRYFGNHDELDEIVPITSVYTAVEARKPDTIPTLWGWETEPDHPRVSLDSVLRIEAVGQSRRANDGLDQPRPRN